MSDEVKKLGKGYGSETPVQKANTLMNKTDKVFNVVDAETPEAARDAHGIPAANSGGERPTGDKRFYSSRNPKSYGSK
jgi:hypothetical protein